MIKGQLLGLPNRWKKALDILTGRVDTLEKANTKLNSDMGYVQKTHPYNIFSDTDYYTLNETRKDNNIYRTQLDQDGCYRKYTSNDGGQSWYGDKIICNSDLTNIALHIETFTLYFDSDGHAKYPTVNGHIINAWATDYNWNISMHSGGLIAHSSTDYTSLMRDYSYNVTVAYIGKGNV